MMFKHPAPLRPIISNSCPCTPTTTLPSSTLPSASPSSSSLYRCHLPQSFRTVKQKRSSGDDVISSNVTCNVMSNVDCLADPSAAVRDLDLKAMWSADWPTMIHIPTPFIQEWSLIFSEALLRLSRFPTMENLTLLFCCSKLLLAAPAHGGKQRLNTTERLLRARLSKWHSGELTSLFNDVQAAWNKKSSKKPGVAADVISSIAPHLPSPLARRVRQLVASGSFSKACKVLCSRGIAADTPQTRASLASLFPQQQQSTTLSTGDVGTFEPSELKAMLERTPLNLAPGPSGLRFDHLKALLLLPDKNLTDHFLFALATFVNAAVSGTFPPELQPYICGGRVIPCNKKDGGIRPIVLGESLRNVVSNSILFQSASVIKPQLHPQQYGVKASGYGIQSAIFKAQRLTADLTNKIILKIDFRNAFNSINRRLCLKTMECLEPDCCAWVSWCLQSPSYVAFKSEVMLCANGVQQGEPMSPLLFSVALDPLLQDLSKIQGLTQIWYLDDGLFYGPPAVVAAAVLRLSELLPGMHLSINLAKCEIYYDKTTVLPPELHNIPSYLDRTGWSFLGAPLTQHSHSCIAAAQDRFIMVNKRISELGLDHPAEALALSRFCTGSCKVQHLLQAGLPPTTCDGFLAQCSDSLCETVSTIVGSALSASQWDLARIPVKLGGLGIHDPSHCVYSARLACLTRLLDLADDLQLDASDVLLIQQSALERFRHDISDSCFQIPHDHSQLQSKLMSHCYKQLAARALRAADSWEQQRLISLSASHATAWTTGSNPWVTMSPTEFRYGLKWILGVALVDNPTRCVACSTVQDCYGRHAVTCRRSGAITRCHNLLRDVTKAIAISAGYTVLSEQTIPNNPAFRPADILILNWKEAKPLALDFTVSTPAITSEGDLEAKIAASLLDKACEKKVRHYRQACEQDGWLFQPFAVDVFGAIHPTARKVAEAIIRQFEVKHPKCKQYPFPTFVWRAITAASVMRAATQTMAAALNPTGTATLLQLLNSPHSKRRALLASSSTEQGTVSDATNDLCMGSSFPLPSASGPSNPMTVSPASSMIVDANPNTSTATSASRLLMLERLPLSTT